MTKKNEYHELISEKLTEKSSNQLYAYAIKLTKDVAEAEDLYQDTVLLALKNSDKFKRGTNFMGWMKVIMKNTFINNYRRKKRFQNVMSEKKKTILANGNFINNGAEVSLAMNDLSDMISKVDEKFRVPFLLYYEGYSYDEIAKNLQVPIGTIKSRIFLARKQIKASYKKIHKVALERKHLKAS